MPYHYRPRGVCAGSIEFDILDGIVRNICISGGCAGNSLGISSLAEGLPAEEVVKRLKGIRCGHKPTSCPDQLALAVEQALKEQQK